MENDLKQLEKIIGLLDFICNTEMETEVGKIFSNTMTEAVEQIIKPEARKIYKQIKDGNINTLEKE